MQGIKNMDLSNADVPSGNERGELNMYMRMHCEVSFLWSNAVPWDSIPALPDESLNYHHLQPTRLGLCWKRELQSNKDSFKEML